MSPSLDNGTYQVQVKSVPTGWRVAPNPTNTLSWGGGPSAAGNPVDYISQVTINNNNQTAAPNRVASPAGNGLGDNPSQRFVLVRDNPPLPDACREFTIAISLDISSSIDTQAKRQALYDGAVAFINGLAGQQVTLRIDTFGTDAATVGTFDLATQAAGAVTAVDGVYQPTVSQNNISWPQNWTNWD